jgi:hypothetical protein
MSMNETQHFGKILMSVGLVTFMLAGCPAEEEDASGPHRISIAATPGSGEVNGPGVEVAVNILKPGNTPLEAGRTVDILEFGCVDTGTDAVGLFEDQEEGADCGATTRTVTGTNGAVSANFRCVAVGETTILAIPTGINDPNDPPGSITINCIAGPTGQWSVESITRTDGFLETGSNEITLEVIAVQDDGETPVPEGTRFEASVEGESLALSGNPVILADSEGKATLKVLTNDKEGESIVKVDFDDPRFGSGGSASFRVRLPSNMRETLLEVTVRKNNLVVNDSERNVLADDESSLSIEAELIAPGGAEFSVAGQPVKFEIKSGVGGFGLGSTLTEDVVTDEANKAQVDFVGGVEAGTTVVEVSVVDPNPENEEEVTLTQTVVINVKSLGFIEFVSINPSVIFVKGSGDNERAEVTFRLLDTDRNPLEGIEVGMALPDSSLGGVDLDPALDLTDAEGFVRTTVESGLVTGTVNVTATAQIGGADPLTASSGSIPIVGRTPSRSAFTVTCDFENMAGLDGVEPGSIETQVNQPISCAGTLLDNFDNPVGLRSSLLFLVEGGQSPATTFSVPWDTELTDVPPANTGTYAFTYNPRGNLPCDVDPDFDAGEPYLFFDEDECSALQRNCPERQEQDCSRNPRDGLVAIVAMTTGAEAFSDTNNDGEYTEGEPFWDLGEPFVDTNDNNEFDLGEEFRDAQNGGDPPNGEYDGPNGAWDGNMTIWTTTHVLLTGGPVEQQTDLDGDPLFNSGFAFDTNDPDEPIGGILPVAGDFVTIGVRWQDMNLNVLNRSNSYDVAVLGDAAGVTLTKLSLDAPTLGKGFSLVYGDRLEDGSRNTYRTTINGIDRNPFSYRTDVQVEFGDEEDEKLVRLQFEATYNTIPGGGAANTVVRIVSLLFQKN